MANQTDVIQYLVKWLKYSFEHDQSKNLSVFNDCLKLVEGYETIAFVLSKNNNFWKSIVFLFAAVSIHGFSILKNYPDKYFPFVKMNPANVTLLYIFDPIYNCFFLSFVIYHIRGDYWEILTKNPVGAQHLQSRFVQRFQIDLTVNDECIYKIRYCIHVTKSFL